MPPPHALTVTAVAIAAQNAMPVRSLRGTRAGC
jgi:hypothetical protein